HRRLLRALALLAEGHSLEDQDGGIWTSQLRHPTRLIGLTCPRDELYARINQRVDEIAAAGAADEVSAALEAGASRTAKMALGFSDLQNGDLEAMKQATRRYAKRQLTWLGKLDQAELIDVGGRSAEQIAEQILSGASGSAA
ncbi:MAG: tRNA dimethylallyltransferase, partial [Solirubrobacterales bacterium]|nr:tRNA dimethylallyltransferase [Solirubrobacterales bacterium]